MENQEITAKKPINPMMILAAILVIAAIATYIVPAGSFDRIPNEATGYDVIDVNSFHYIESNLDAGTIIAQRHVPIYPDDTVDTLETRVHETEHELYPETVKKILTERIAKEKNNQ